jgi:hypothetical protein
VNTVRTALDKEALRQQMLLRALWGDARPGVVAGWLRDGPRAARGLAAYRANAGAAAERALAAAYPTVQLLLGDESFAALARACWQRHPPTAGDLGLWGDALPAFIAGAESLADEPYLADVARLEWAVHRAERAADVAPPQGLERLAGDEPAALVLRLAPGTALIDSSHPIATIWQAHRSTAADRFAPVRAAFETGAGECALVARDGWRATVRALPAGEARFTRAVLAGRSLGDSLNDALGDALGATPSDELAAAGAAFDFEAWLIAALQQQRLAAVEPAAAGTAEEPGPAQPLTRLV